MDGNKDDALKCLNIGKAALAAGDSQRARKFLAKASRLDPSLDIDEFLSACNEANGKESSQAETPVSNNENVSSKRENSGGNSSGGGVKGYTDEQLEIVRQIKRNRDYYTILGLEKSCSVEEVRKAYRKLSLKVHPDKNKAPGSEEAFKAVSKAFQCLSDEEMRRKYDVTGPEEEFEVAQHQQYARRRRTHQGFYDEGFDPDEIFRQFFFGGASPQADFFTRAHVVRTRAAAAGSQGGRTHEGGFNMFTLLQILPILILFLVTYLPYSEPQYSLEKSYPYVTRKITKEFGVQYFVKSQDFEREFPPDSTERANLEFQVIRDYKGHVARYCQLELQRRQWTGQKETPFCDKLRQFERVR